MPSFHPMLAQGVDYGPGYPSDAAFGGLFAVFALLGLATAVLVLASMWTLFKKAGQPGWAAIVPIYNLIVLLRIVHRPLWWILLYLVPIVNLVVSIIVAIDLAKAFGKDPVWAIGLVLLPFVFYPMLAWGETTYDESRIPARAA